MFIGKRKNIIESEESSGEEVWNEFAKRQQSFTFTGKSGLLMDLPSDIKASEVLLLFLDENLISLLVTETNRYAEQKLQQETTEHARSKRWKPTTCAEIKKFIGLMIWMGLVKTPLVTCWSKDPIYNFAFPRSQMSRNRFELLLANLHFANNETIEEGNRLGKVLPLLNLLVDNYQKVFSPGEDIDIHGRRKYILDEIPAEEGKLA
ncbi:piggyBac transposable element-derived protein 4-like [Polistes fuscatus]|uniref:piggyBac transposable element-derived protein 4-like n=1 Tax=Polistes fuscatus TaxID=30207 RepID=UPI001CA988CC|nr:piggyBac transposable element-derived protein 4-like [Polistes fuscatus]